jgi:hypothetical protein
MKSEKRDVRSEMTWFLTGMMSIRGLSLGAREALPPAGREPPAAGDADATGQSRTIMRPLMEPAQALKLVAA